jgi:hypothetical protein
MGPEMLPRVQPWLAAGNPSLQRDALRLYREWGAAVRRALSDVEPFLDDDDPLTRLAARAAAAQMTGQVTPHLPSVTACLADDDREVRRVAARLLIEWGKNTPAVVAAVERMRDDPRRQVRTAVHHVLEQVAAQKP